jgi:hypothetical protein
MEAQKLSINKAFQMLENYHAPITLKNHINSVTKISTFISKKYFDKNLISKEDLYQIIISSLLHDLMKLVETKDFEKRYSNDKTFSNEAKKFWLKKREQYKNICHEEAGYEELKNKNLEIAKIILSHRFRNIDNLKNIKEEILYYSDKLDEWGKIFPLGKRLIYAHLRYIPKHGENNWVEVLKIDKKIFQLEEKIFEKINTKAYECEKLNDITLNELFKKLNIDLEFEV